MRLRELAHEARMEFEIRTRIVFGSGRTVWPHTDRVQPWISVGPAKIGGRTRGATVICRDRLMYVALWPKGD